MDDQVIVGTARRMLQEGGMAALSMRKLASELGVAPTAIYWHVGGRDELLGRLFDAMVAELPPLRPEGSTPHERIRSLALAMRTQFRESHQVRQLALELGRSSELAVRNQLIFAREVQRAGFVGEQAAQIVQALTYTVGGFILLDTVFAQTVGVPTSHELWLELAPDGLDPALVAAMGRPPDTDAIFAAAVDRLLDGTLTA